MYETWDMYECMDTTYNVMDTNINKGKVCFNIVNKGFLDYFQVNRKSYIERLRV